MRVASVRGNVPVRCPSSGSVSKRFGEKQLFRNLTMDVRYKEHVALLGRNGCGKTTLLRMVLGEIPADEGILKIGRQRDRRLSSPAGSFPEGGCERFRSLPGRAGNRRRQAREELARYLLPGRTYLRRWRIFPEGKRADYILQN